MLQQHRIYIVGFLGLFFTINSAAQSFRNYSNEFLNIGVDAAALGLSKAVVATSNDVNAVYWNPAGLVDLKDYQGAVMHASYFAGIANYDFVAFAMPIDNRSALGVSVIRFGVDDILNTTELIDSEGNINFNNISLFSAADYAVTFSYARNLVVDELYIGGNAKIIRRIIGDFASSWGVGFDLGLQFQRGSWKLGIMARDITTTFNTWSINQAEFDKIKDAIPTENQLLPTTTELTKPKLQIGAARKFKMGRFFHLVTEIDANIQFAKTNDLLASNAISIAPAVGIQVDYDHLVFLRAGIGNMQYIQNYDESQSLSVQPNFGIGFQYRGVQIDYALTNIGSVGNALYSNIFSLKFDYQFFRH